jgi:hypothetical protein
MVDIEHRRRKASGECLVWCKNLLQSIMISLVRHDQT